jgi:tetratricopeptide (TPR) repeat protein
MNCIRSRAKLLLSILLFAMAPFSRADEVAEVNQLAKAGQTTEAMVKLDQFLAVKPKDPQLRFLKGVMLTDSKRTADAIAVFTLLIEDYPELPEPYNNLAVLYAGQGQYDKARAALEAAVRGNPNYATAYENLGDVYARLAAQAYVRALALDGTNASLPPKIAQLRTLFTAKPAETRAGAPGHAAKTTSP